MDALGKSKGDVAMELGGSLDPILVTHTESKAISVVMPMRI